jgi:hypothetical protein
MTWWQKGLGGFVSEISEEFQRLQAAGLGLDHSEPCCLKRDIVACTYRQYFSLFFSSFSLGYNMGFSKEKRKSTSRYRGVVVSS